jgi:hypothetical protein
MSGNTVLRTNLCNRRGGKGGQRISSPNIIMVIQLRKMSWVVHVRLSGMGFDETFLLAPQRSRPERKM